MSAKIESGVRRCAVIGNPIAHSKSPILHAAFAAQFGLALDYFRQGLEPAEVEPFVRSFFAEGGSGLNVTLPYKETVLPLADECRPRAWLAGAANTLGSKDGRIWADNTDGVGLVRDLARLGVAVKGRRILLLGCGGAALGALPALLEAGASEIQLLNRTSAKPEALLARYQSGPGAPYRSRLMLHRAGLPVADILVSSVSEGAMELLSAAGVALPAIAYDLNYGPRAEGFVQAMQQAGVALVLTGKGMLIEQAAESFWLWHGLRPDTAALHAGELT